MLDTGYNNWVPRNKILAVNSFHSAPIKKMIRSAEEQNKVINHGAGHRIHSVITVEGGFLVLCARTPETLKERWLKNEMLC